MLGWCWTVTRGLARGEMLVKAGDTVLGTHKISFTAIGGSCPDTTSREAPVSVIARDFRAPTPPNPPLADELCQYSARSPHI